MQFLEDLRKKPRSTKGRYALMGSVGVTLFIAVIWGVSLPARFGEIPTKTAEEQPEESNIIDQLGSQLGSVIDVLDLEEGNGTDEIEEVTSHGLSGLDINELVESARQSEENLEVEGIEESTEERPRVILIATTTTQTGQTEE